LTTVGGVVGGGAVVGVGDGTVVGGVVVVGAVVGGGGGTVVGGVVVGGAGGVVVWATGVRFMAVALEPDVRLSPSPRARPTATRADVTPIMILRRLVTFRPLKLWWAVAVRSLYCP
jgi:hypothetical protein